MRQPLLQLRARRGRLLLLLAPPGRPVRLALVAGRQTPRLRYLLIHDGGLTPGDPGDRPTTTGARHLAAAPSAA